MKPDSTDNSNWAKSALGHGEKKPSADKSLKIDRWSRWTLVDRVAEAAIVRIPDARLEVWQRSSNRRLSEFKTIHIMIDFIFFVKGKQVLLAKCQ